LAAALDRVFACLDAGDGMVILFLENIEQRPPRQAQVPDALQQGAPNGPGNGDAHPQADQPRQDDQERRRMIEDDRNHRNDIQLPAPGADLPNWE
ncbi:hypothetical protein, partial [Xanthomonas fragariae]